MSQAQYCKALVEDRTIFFELSAGQLYGQGAQTVPIYWEEEGQGFSGEMDLADVLELTIEEDTLPIEE